MSTPTPARRGFRCLTSKERAEAIALWESGQVTLEELSKKFSKSTSTFVKMFAKAKVVRGSRGAALAAKVAAKAEETLIADAAIVSERIRQTKDGAYRVLDAIGKLVAFELTDARIKKEAISTRANNIKTLKAAAETIVQTWNGRAAILGLDKEQDPDGALPELPIRELTVEQIKKMVSADAVNTGLDDELDALDAIPNPAEPALEAEDDEALEIVQV